MNKFFLDYGTKILFLVLFLLAGSTLAIYYNLLPAPTWLEQTIPRKTLSVTTSMVNTTNKPLQLLRSASVESPKSAPVHAEFSGRIGEVYVKEGELVKVDQPLVKILYSSLAGRNRSKVTTSENPGQGSMEYDNALKEYNRLQKLYSLGAIPKRQLDNAEVALQAAKSNPGNSQSTGATPPDNDTGSVSSGSTTITAPNPGTVTGLAISPGTMIEAGQPMMVLDVGEVQLVVHIEQKDLYLLHPGTPATTEVSGQTIIGQVANIYPEAGANNTLSFRAHINIPKNSDGLLKPGMSVNVRLNTDKTTTIHSIPTVALFQDEQGLSYVYLIENGKALRQQISIGESLADSTEITSKLPEQAIIITSNVKHIKDGDTVIVSQ